LLEEKERKAREKGTPNASSTSFTKKRTSVKHQNNKHQAEKKGALRLKI
jgi:hypothetical protein